MMILCQLRFARLLLTLLRWHNWTDYPWNSMYLLSQHRLHARFEQWWKLWRALADFCWLYSFFWFISEALEVFVCFPVLDKHIPWRNKTPPSPFRGFFLMICLKQFLHFKIFFVSLDFDWHQDSGYNVGDLCTARDEDLCATWTGRHVAIHFHTFPIQMFDCKAGKAMLIEIKQVVIPWTQRDLSFAWYSTSTNIIVGVPIILLKTSHTTAFLPCLCDIAPLPRSMSPRRRWISAFVPWSKNGTVGVECSEIRKGKAHGTLPPRIVQWKIGVSPIFVSFHFLGDFHLNHDLWEEGYHVCQKLWFKKMPNESTGLLPSPPNTCDRWRFVGIDTPVMCGFLACQDISRQALINLEQNSGCTFNWRQSISVVSWLFVSNSSWLDSDPSECSGSDSALKQQQSKTKVWVFSGVGPKVQ